MNKAIPLIFFVILASACAKNAAVRNDTTVTTTPPGTPTFQTVMDGRRYVLYRDDRVKYYEGDILMEAVLAEDMNVSNGMYRFRLAAEHPVGFYRNGRLEYGWLADTNDFDGVTFVPGRVTFYTTGEIADGYIASGESVAGIGSEDDYPVFFFQNGNARLILSDDTVEIAGVKFMGDKLLAFYPDGNLWRGVLAEDTAFFGVVYKKKTTVMFQPNGRIWQGTLAKQTVVDGTAYRAGTRLTYDGAGKVVNAE